MISVQSCQKYCIVYSAEFNKAQSNVWLVLFITSGLEIKSANWHNTHAHIYYKAYILDKKKLQI